MGKLIILRGNSGSGKTTVAKELQKKFGYNTMPISQDEIRRNILRVKDGIDTKALPLMIELLKYGYEHSDIVILGGIMYDEQYNPLFKVANELYGSNVYSYYFDIPFEETIRRHQTRSKSQEFGEEHMRGWWREKDFSAVLKEQLITCEMDANSIVAKVYADLLKEEQKMRHDIIEYAEISPVIGRTVTVTVDRPLGSYHPEHKDMYYPINYGYVEGIMAPDGEEQDAYILGVDEAIEKFTGKIIAIVHRNDDVEEKWVVAPEGMTFTKEEIREQIHFQEQYFDSEIVM